ncbi:hypothetical protein, partial [Enterobacter hormaechei]
TWPSVAGWGVRLNPPTIPGTPHPTIFSKTKIQATPFLFLIKQNLFWLNQSNLKKLTSRTIY